MGGFLSNFVFLNPWALAALGALPLLYILLRVTPPAPKIIKFPATRFLKDLQPRTQTTSHTPWWILLLRLLIAALVLLALAKPVLHPSSVQAENQPLHLIIDNGWASAQNWDETLKTAEDLIKNAGRNAQDIYIQTTGTPSKQKPSPMVQSDALSFVKALRPVPWPGDYRDIQDFKFDGQVAYLSDGYAHEGFDAFAARHGVTDIFKPQDDDLSAFLMPPRTLGETPAIFVNGPQDAKPPASLKVQMLGTSAKVIDEQNVPSDASSFPVKIEFDVPQTLSAQISGYRIPSQKGAGARYILNTQGGPKTVGIVAPEDASDARQFIEDGFYLTKALEPYATQHTGQLADILEQNPSMIILPNVGAMPPESLNALDEWVKNGGLLLRFAGPNMTQSQSAVSALTPVPLRRDSRNMEGSLSWDEPLKIASFAESSPLYGLTPPEDVEIYAQILPETTDTLQDRVWATLEDGTPFITANKYDAGLLVMVHTTASPAWSNLSLSGFYVDLLKRFLKLAGNTRAVNVADSGMLQPIRIMDGFGTLQAPLASVKPIDAAVFDDTLPSADHPPGLYGRGPLQNALNIGDHPPRLTLLPSGNQYASHYYGGEIETDLAPYFISAAAALFLIDAFVLIILSLGLSLVARASAAIVLVFCFMPSAAHAQVYANDLYLAYIKSGNTGVDAQTEKGLNVMADILGARTSAEPAGVVGVSPSTDDLSFFPLLYWVITPEARALPSDGLANLQSYLDQGGTILIDTRGGNVSSMSAKLREVMGGLNISPMMPIPDDHVLGKSFYLLDQYPGRYNDGSIWIEQESASGRDGVSSIILGGNDWAGGWADIDILKRGNIVAVRGGDRQQELSLRFGVNLVMYALTGNYKADQVHVPHILERLGQ